MFDTTAYFDSEQITSILMVSAIHVHYWLPNGKINSRHFHCKSLFKEVFGNIVTRVCVANNSSGSRVMCLRQDLSNYKYNKMVNRSLALLNKFYSAKSRLFKMCVQAMVSK